MGTQNGSKGAELVKITEARWAELENAYLEQILLFLRARCPDDRVLRTLIDGWFAYHARDLGLLDRKLRPVWLNVGDLDPRNCHAKLRRMHAISDAARAWLERALARDEELLRMWRDDKKRHGLAKDHVFPLRELCVELRERSFDDCVQLRTFLAAHYRVAIITQEEHRRFAGATAHTMPEGWQDIFQRYHDHGIPFRQGGWDDVPRQPRRFAD